MTSEMAVQPKPRKITVSEYHRMLEVGILYEGERVELLDGVIVEMSPIGSPHYWVHSRIVRYLNHTLPEQVAVLGMASVCLGEYNEPQPDIIIADQRGAANMRRLEVGDVLAVIEISDSSVRTDTGPKRRLYGSFALPDYFIVDLDKQVLLRYSDSRDGAYPEPQRLSRGATFSLQSLPDLRLDAAAFLPPTTEG